jgi:hypothetical protein
MSARVWPSREEWQAKAEYAVRTSCTMYERLDRVQGHTDWSTLAEDQEAEDLAFAAAGTLRSLLTAEIDELRQLLPDRPKTAHQRGKWAVALGEEAYETAINLGALEQIRTELHRARAAKNWREIAWQLGRVRHSYSAIQLPARLIEADDRLQVIFDRMDTRRRKAAEEVEQAAVDREIARRATDQAWAEEMERRAAIDHPRVIRVGQTPPIEGERVT